MRIRVTAFGELCEHFGKETHVVELAEGATLADLLVRWEELWGERLPAGLWNRKQHRFRGPVVVRLGDRLTREWGTALADGQEVGLYRALVGG